jgi:hypothetical protein
MQLSEENKKKLEHLESFNVTIEDYNEKSVSFTDDYSYDIEFDDFEISDTLEQIIRWSTILSPCCGEVLDTDWMICPSCKEHC